ncbi:Eclosion hormone [Armadillidium nasatum]|uniref:Eclosion hormone n=1 Tax=Armadillidium nasatum TaxID=96803 RepID=A0A5N5TCJ3_9CRUS|nr:Eclosion hormone [Armadillidium nasatum]
MISIKEIKDLKNFFLYQRRSTIVKVNLRNCGHCKEIYGDYFNGQACAENCILTKGQAAPDCNDPVTFKRFLKKLM